VFEIKKPILPNPADYKVIFNQPAPLPTGTPGSIVRSSTPFNATSLPFALFTLQKCSVLSFHFHPLGNEQLFIVKGERRRADVATVAWRRSPQCRCGHTVMRAWPHSTSASSAHLSCVVAHISHQLMMCMAPLFACACAGKVEVGMFFEDGQLRQVQVQAGEGVIIPQGTVHFVRNLDPHDTLFLQVFDHPQAGAQFVGPALLKMPADVLASAFNGTFPTAVTGTIFKLKQCPW
jgi:quercetin dioxygenase-like cupin family protein